MATTSAPALLPLERGESCAYLKPDSVTGCRAPRSCRSCLETSGCMIDYAGSCMSQQAQAYDPAHAYERAISDGLALPNATASRTVMSAMQSWLFPAGRVAYCDASQDAVCRECTRSNFWRPKTTYPDSRFCVGDAGSCVCIDVCERPWIAKPDCSSNGGLSPAAAPTRVVMVGGPNGYGSTARSVFYAFLGVTFFVVIALGLVVRARLGGAATESEARAEARAEARRRREQARRDRRNAQLGVNPLTLTGWAAYRRDLIDKEAAQLAASESADKVDENLTNTVAASSVDANGHDGDDDHDCGRPEENGVVYVRVHDDDASTSVVTAPATSTASELSSLAPARPLLLAPLAGVQRLQPSTQ